jgi:hypothetical protein
MLIVEGRDRVAHQGPSLHFRMRVKVSQMTSLYGHLFIESLSARVMRATEDRCLFLAN